MRRLVPVAVALLLASCAAANTSPTPSPPIDQTAGDQDYGGAPPQVVPSTSPTGPAVLAATETPHVSVALGEKVVATEADFDCDGRADRLEFFARISAAPQAPGVL